MPKHDGYQRSSRSEQPDQGAPDQPAKIALEHTIDRFAGVSHCFGFAVGTAIPRSSRSAALLLEQMRNTSRCRSSGRNTLSALVVWMLW